MALQTQDFTTLVSNQVAAAQAESTALLDFSTGSVLLALIEANTSAVALWLQALILQLLSVTRLATSQASDVDSWVGDFGLTRLPAVAATGTVTFSRFTNTQQAVIIANATPSLSTQVQTADGTQSFYVAIDTTNINYNAALGGYVIQAGTSSISVPVQANVAGSGGNVLTGAISTLITPTPFVDTVTNASPFTNGLNQELDAALKARFPLFIASLSRATKSAIGYAIQSTQQGLSYTLTENQSYAGQTEYGYFYVVVDDGSGNPPTQLLNNISSAIDQYRAASVTFGVFAPVVTTVNVVVTITVDANTTHSAAAVIVQNAISTYINSLAVGQTLYYTQLINAIYDADVDITNVTGLTLNGGTSDITADSKHIIKVGTITIN